MFRSKSVSFFPLAKSNILIHMIWFHINELKISRPCEFNQEQVKSLITVGRGGDCKSCQLISEGSEYLGKSLQFHRSTNSNLLVYWGETTHTSSALWCLIAELSNKMRKAWQVWFNNIVGENVLWVCTGLRVIKLVHHTNLCWSVWEHCNSCINCVPSNILNGCSVCSSEGACEP